VDASACHRNSSSCKAARSCRHTARPAKSSHAIPTRPGAAALPEECHSSGDKKTDRSCEWAPVAAIAAQQVAGLPEAADTLHNQPRAATRSPLGLVLQPFRKVSLRWGQKHSEVMRVGASGCHSSSTSCRAARGCRHTAQPAKSSHEIPLGLAQQPFRESATPAQKHSEVMRVGASGCHSN